MTKHVWWGVLGDGKSALADEAFTRQVAIADAAEARSWTVLARLLSEDPILVNSTRPGDDFRYTPLHHAARLGAPTEVVQALIDQGALRALRTKDGLRAVDIARRRGNTELASILEPPRLHPVGAEDLRQMQRHFHSFIFGYAGEFVTRNGLWLPELECLLELDPPEVMFQVPGLHGGFSYELTGDEHAPMLRVSSWCRVAQGSGERCEVTPQGYRIVETGWC